MFFAYERTSAGEKLAVYLNFGDQEVAVDAAVGEVVLATRPDHPGVDEGSLRLGAHEGVVLNSVARTAEDTED